MQYKDIENKSIFDYTDDAQIIYEITGVDITGQGKGLSKEYYLKANGSLLKLHHIRTLARHTENQQLLKAVEKQISIIEHELEEKERNTGTIFD